MPGIQHYTVSAIYDDAVVLDAYLAMHTGTLGALAGLDG